MCTYRLVILLVSPCIIKGLAKGRSLLQGKLLTYAIFKDAKHSSDAIYWIFYEGKTFPLCCSLSMTLRISPISSAYKSVSRFVEHLLTALSTQSLHNEVLNALINNKYATFYVI